MSKISDPKPIEWMPVDLLAQTLPDDLPTVRLYLRVRRRLEILLVIALAPVVAAVGLIVAIAIVAESGWPVFFGQRRYNQAGPFLMWKFRSMCSDAESAHQLTLDGDNRITRVGHFIRKSHLDELPQLWHVLRGEMSLIGPRPEPYWVVQEAEHQITGYHLRHLVPSGMTGWAQIHQGYTDDLEAVSIKLIYDLYYVKNLSVWLDVQILFKTAWVLVTGRGSR